MTANPDPPRCLAPGLLAALLAILVSAPAAVGQQPGTSPVKIFILAGQSNMQGHGEMSPVTTPGTLSYTVWTSTNMVDWIEDTVASASQVPGRPYPDSTQGVTVTLSTALLAEPRLFVQIRARETE